MKCNKCKHEFEVKESKADLDARLAKQCLDEKWYMLARGEKPRTIRCSLCGEYKNNNGCCVGCPLTEFRTRDWGETECCDAYRDWFVASPKDKPTKALAMVRFLERIARIGVKDSPIQEKPQVKTTVTVWWERHSAFGATKPFHTSTYSFSGTPDIDRIICRTKLGEPDGALVIKVECTEPFIIEDGSFSIVCIFDENKLKYNKIFGYSYNGYRVISRAIDSDIEAAITDYLAQKEQDIKVGDIVWHGNQTGRGDKERLAFVRCIDLQGILLQFADCLRKEEDSAMYDIGIIPHLRKATPNEVLAYFTKEVDGNLFVAYEMGNNKYKRIEIKCTCMDGGESLTVCQPFYLEHVDSIMRNSFLKSYNIIPIPYIWWSMMWDKMQYPRRK
jgi:hypothetical protein